MPMKFAAILLFALMSVPAFAQKKVKKAGPLTEEAVAALHAYEDTLGVLSYAMVNDSIEIERFAAAHRLITLLVQALKTPNSFQYRFDRLKSISILSPPDSSFRIFSWQLFVNDSTYRYYGAIQMNRPELLLYPLRDKSFEMDRLPTHDILEPDRWYGAVYYNLRAFDMRGGGTHYLLMGFDAVNFFNRRKIMDVLYFDEEGKPHFGAPVFDRGDAPGFESGEMRIILEYSAEASVRLNWDEQYQVVLFDHLIPVPSPHYAGMTNVPDGSYEAFQFTKGRWKYIPKIFNDVNEEVPMPEPILDSRKDKDILGKSKKKKGKTP
jgi:hypothetical protein